MIKTVLDEGERGREGRRDNEEEGTRRKEGSGGRGDEMSEKMKKLLTKMASLANNIGFAGPCLWVFPKFKIIWVFKRAQLLR